MGLGNLPEAREIVSDSAKIRTLVRYVKDILTVKHIT